jgi:hypothetical protein
MYKKEVKLPVTGLEKPSGLQEAEVPRISRHSAHEGGKVVSPMHWLTLLPVRSNDVQYY